MCSNASTDSISDISTLSSANELDPFDAEQTSDEVANFFQKMSMTTTRRLPAKNVPDGGAPYIYETVKKTTKTLISQSLTPPVEMLKKFRNRRASKRMAQATRRDGENPAPVAPPPQAEMAGTHVPMSGPSPAIPIPVYRPIIRVYGDDEEMPPDHPRYPEAQSTDFSADATAQPPNTSVNHAAAPGQAAPAISSDSAIASQSPPTACPWGNSVAAIGNLAVSSASATPVAQLGTPGAVAPAPRPFVNVTDSGAAIRPFVTTADGGATARPSVAFVAAAGSQAVPIASPPSTSQGARPSGTQTDYNASPLRPSARGSQLRRQLIREVLGEDSAPSAP